jgi:transcriptional regulator with XRE-family HTH domain
MDESLLDNLDFLRERLKQARKEANLSIIDLAHKVGVSPASISKIEKAKMVPTIAVLLRIIRAYDKPLAFFFKGKESSIECYITRLKQRHSMVRFTNDGKSRSKIEILSAPFAAGVVDSAIIILAPKVTSAGSHVTHSGEEVAYCLKGKIELIFGKTSAILNEGDSVHFNGLVPHNYRNVGPGEARIIYFIARDKK